MRDADPRLVELFRRVYDVLVDRAGAPVSQREDFVRRQTEKADLWRTDEWRFGGLLGMGGKFWAGPEHFFVNCYPEDRTPSRVSVMVETNAELKPLFDQYVEIFRQAT